MNLRDDQGRPEPPLASGEAETLVGFLEYQRATFAWKWSGLEAAGLKATLGASTMTLGGMLKHLAYYEDHWFSHRMRGNKRQAVWSDDYWDDDPDWEWNSATEDSPRGCTPSGRTRCPAPAICSPRPWRAAALTSWHDAACRTVARPACGGSWCT